jgi:hypothetical protein
LPRRARIHFAPEERYINRKKQTHDRTFAPEEQYIYWFALILEVLFAIPMQLCHAPLERYILHCLFFLLIYCPDGAKIHLAAEVRHIICTSLTKTKQLCHAPLERFILHCLTFLLIYCPDGARIHFDPEERYINRKKQTHDRKFAPEEQYINWFTLILEVLFAIPMQLCHAPLERYILHCLTFLLIYCPDGARIRFAPEVRHSIRTSLTKTKQLCHAPLERFILHCLTFLLIYCPDGAKIHLAAEVRHIIRTSLTKTKQLYHGPLEHFILHCLTFLLIYCPDGARIHFAPERRNINNIISEKFFAPEEQYINKKTP